MVVSILKCEVDVVNVCTYECDESSMSVSYFSYKLQKFKLSELGDLLDNLMGIHYVVAAFYLFITIPFIWGFKIMHAFHSLEKGLSIDFAYNATIKFHLVFA